MSEFLFIASLVILGIGALRQAQADLKDSKNAEYLTLYDASSQLKRRANLFFAASATCLFTALCLTIKFIIDAQV